MPNEMSILETKAPVFRMFLGDGRNLVLLNELRYEIPNSEKVIVVPAGFVTDLTSTPALLTPIVPTMGRHTVAAIVHDYLYWDQRCGKEKADRLFQIAMDEYEAKRAWLAEKGVQLGGMPSWEQNNSDKGRGLAKILEPKQIQEIPINAQWEDYRDELLRSGYREKELDGHPTYCDAI